MIQTRFGYLSIHVDVRLRADDPDMVHYADYFAELQIRTLGQHLWSEMSHSSVYKNDDMLAVLPVAFRRRVNLMAGLIEVADQEFNRLNEEYQPDAAARLYKSMGRHYFKLTTRGQTRNCRLKSSICSSRCTVRTRRRSRSFSTPFS